jgi:hypothetical protein
MKPTKEETESMRCFMCKEELSPENDGVIMNEGTSNQVCQCNDCHHIEHGYYLMTDLLHFKNMKKEETVKQEKSVEDIFRADYKKCIELADCFNSQQQRIAELENQIRWEKDNLISNCDAFQEIIEGLRAELKRKDEALGFGEAWPLPDVLSKLVESTEYLLDVKNYDKVGWEEVSHCTKLGRQYIDKINSVIAEQALKEKP